MGLKFLMVKTTAVRRWEMRVQFPPGSPINRCIKKAQNYYNEQKWKK